MKEERLNGGLLAKGLALLDDLVLPNPVILYRKVPSTYVSTYLKKHRSSINTPSKHVVIPVAFVLFDFPLAHRDGCFSCTWREKGVARDTLGSLKQNLSATDQGVDLDNVHVSF